MGNPLDCSRTGDLVRKGSQGLYYYAGRTDRQVKIRGYRISPEEVEGYMAHYPGIGDAAVLPIFIDSQSAWLCAFYRTTSSVDIQTLKQFLLEHLPTYMVPVKYIQIDQFDLTPFR